MIEHLCLLIGYAIVISMVHLKSYRHILFMNIFSNAFVGIYLYMNDAYTGAAAVSIAGAASLFQLTMPQSNTPKVMFYRNAGASAFLVAAIGFLYARPSDILPCLANLTNRFAEAQASEQILRFGLGISSFFWLSYAIANNLPMLAGLEICLGASSFWAFWTGRKKLRPVPIPVTNTYSPHTTDHR
ncbi:MAG: YgjV family protein [Pseudomonadota bacterium]|nr:YgjV family protein [Pseudomonadota bacterium]MEC8665892.1 YgjV family protein [Pseudomonadota bacterium]